jgi:hypothetical protein
MNEFLSNHTNQADALASIADSLTAISCCAQYLTVLMAGLLVLKIYKVLFKK